MLQKNVCPEGWRLPSRDDFELLLSTVCDNVFYYQGNDGAVDIEDNDAEKLKSQVVALWSCGVGMVRMIMDFQQFQITDNQEVQLFGLQVCIKLMPEG